MTSMLRVGLAVALMLAGVGAITAGALTQTGAFSALGVVLAVAAALPLVAGVSMLIERDESQS